MTISTLLTNLDSLEQHVINVPVGIIEEPFYIFLFVDQLSICSHWSMEDMDGCSLAASHA